MDAIDVQAERERSRARRQAKADAMQRRRRALRLLDGRWNASRSALKAAIAEVYTKMTPAERRALLDVTLEVQRTERPHVDPTTVHTRPPAPEIFRGKGPKRAPRAEIPEPMEEDTEVAKKKFTPEQRVRFLDWLRAWRAENPKATGAEGHRAMQDHFGIEMSEQSFRSTYWIKAVPSAADRRAAAGKKAERANAPAPEEAAALGRKAAPSGADQVVVSRPGDLAEDEPGSFPPPAVRKASAPAALTPEQERHAESGSVPDGAEGEGLAQPPTRAVVPEGDSTASAGEANESSREANEANQAAADLKLSEAIHELAAAPYRGADRVAAEGGNGNGARRGQVGLHALGAPPLPEWIAERRAAARAASEIVEGERIGAKVAEVLANAEKKIAALEAEVARLQEDRKVSEEFVALQQGEDGRWKLRMRLVFDDLAPAAAVLELVGKAVAASKRREEVAHV